LTSENQTLNLTLYTLREMLTKCSKINQAYKVLCANWTRKIWCKSILTLHRYRDFCVGVF